MAEARARGCEGVWLGTELDNEVAQSFYRSLGAEECHLHVFADNSAGRGLWARLGLAPHHSMRHLVVVEGSAPRSARSDTG